MERSSRIFVHYVDEQIIKDIAGNWDFALVSVAVLSLDCWFQRCSKSLCGCFLNGCILRISKSCCSSQRTDLCTKYCPLVKQCCRFCCSFVLHSVPSMVFNPFHVVIERTVEFSQSTGL